MIINDLQKHGNNEKIETKKFVSRIY